MLTPDRLENTSRFDSFDNGEVLHNKKKNHLPAMGWNSWNAFGSGNTEALSKAMADKMVELGLRELGYEFVILDDGCYKPERVDGRLSNEEIKFPSGFKALSDYIHNKGLKFGMYNDIGTNLCAGAAVGTCGHEDADAKSYLEWGVDFLKVDNCYYPFDNATFSNAENARYTFAPNIRSIKIDGTKIPVSDGKITGFLAKLAGDEGTEPYVTFIGTFDGTGPDATPVGVRSSELVFELDSKDDSEAELIAEYATGKEEGVGEWLQLIVNGVVVFDDFLPETEDKTNFMESTPFKINLKKGKNEIRLANHRRQENTLNSYARLLRELVKDEKGKDIIYSACEWGKTHPQNWAYKVCDSWRILNDITFQVGSDGDPGKGAWQSDYTTSVMAQYNKAVIMDEFAGLSKGWNDPDMLMIGMNGLNEIQCKTHMTMWCMMNSPLMLGLDLRKVNKGDWIYDIISNKDLIALNQDPLGIQAKRVFSSIATGDPTKEYLRDNNRVDILVKPLAGGRFAISFINAYEEEKRGSFSVSVSDIQKYFKDAVKTASTYRVKNLWTGEESENTSGVFEVTQLEACDNITIVVEASPK